MTGKRIYEFFDNLLWAVVYMLPLIMFIFMSIRIGEYTTFEAVFNTLGLSMVSDNIIYTAYDSIFGATGVLPLFSDTGILMYVTYFSACVCLHFIVDVVLWLIRWAHDFLDRGGKKLW